MKMPDPDDFSGRPLLPHAVPAALLDDARDSVWQVDAQGITTYANAALAALLGYDGPDALIGARAEKFIAEEEAEAHRQQMGQRCFGHPGQYERRLRKRDGAVIRCQVQSMPLFSDDGRYAGAAAVLRPAAAMADGTCNGGAPDDHAVCTAQARGRLAVGVFLHAREAIMIAATDGTILDVNNAFLRITGYLRHEVVGRNPRILQSGRHDKDFYAALWHQIGSQGYWEGEVWNRRKNGEVYCQRLSISSVRDAHGKTLNYVSLFSDITEQKAHVQQLEHVVHYDTLTGLPNRLLLSERLGLALARARRHGTRVAVACFDVDGFKQINDRYGHALGDRLLAALAGRLQQVVRESDIVARIGGDGFIVVFQDLPDAADYQGRTVQILSALAEGVQLGAHVYRATACAGIALFPQAEEVDAEQLLRQAHQALYQAKLGGRNRYSEFDAALDRSVRGRNEMQERIRLGLQQNELELHYQPVVHLRSGEVPFAEALLRWRHPERGLVPPGEFLPLIEDHPLIVDVGYWTLDAALDQICAWRAEGVEIGISVNVSAHQLQQPDFVQQLERRLRARPEVQPGQLKLEVLETSALDDIGHVTRVIAGCHDIGVPFALDDFGTGYSSLLYLKRLPARQIKIDQSFVRDMLDDPEDLAILEGIIGLAAAFRRDTVAEGVETLEHAELLLQLGCGHAQGYGIARPMPGSAMPGWLRGWQPPPHWKHCAALQREDLPLLYATVEHRAWMRHLEASLARQVGTIPELGHDCCRFGAWMLGEGRRRYGAHPLFAVLVTTHECLHSLAAELLAAAAGQPPHSAPPGMPPRLQALHQDLLQLLARLRGAAETEAPA